MQQGHRHARCQGDGLPRVLKGSWVTPLVALGHTESIEDTPVSAAAAGTALQPGGGFLLVAEGEQDQSEPAAQACIALIRVRGQLECARGQYQVAARLLD